MRPLAPILVVLVALVAAPAAVAKEITEVRACGVDDCVTTTDPAILQGLMNGGPPTVPPSGRRDAIRLTATISEPGGKEVGQWHSEWIPALQLLASEDGNWMSLPADAEKALSALALKPFPGKDVPAPPPASAPAPASAPDDGGIPAWLLIAGGLAVLVALAAAAVFAQRPERGVSPELR